MEVKITFGFLSTIYNTMGIVKKNEEKNGASSYDILIINYFVLIAAEKGLNITSKQKYWK